VIQAVEAAIEMPMRYGEIVLAARGGMWRESGGKCRGEQLNSTDCDKNPIEWKIAFYIRSAHHFAQGPGRCVRTFFSRLLCCFRFQFLGDASMLNCVREGFKVDLEKTPSDLEKTLRYHPLRGLFSVWPSLNKAIDAQKIARMTAAKRRTQVF